ncbi:DUF934 domain-containing protein [Amphibiibacter pelophylacis]|uniref:DUF934 domain-containing protein n=1 Tax=Amphibiibacter pelophylacis TaxID=1799477 RepID=A0ACC6P2Q2_9BURK
MKFIQTAQDPWRTAEGEDGPKPHPVARDHLLLTLEQWHAVRDTWPANFAVGVILSNTADVAQIEADLPRLTLIALQFPKWVDGRAYSQAHVLRARHKYSGEVRATGEVLVDMVVQLARTGFDAAVLAPGQNEAYAREALAFFPQGHYQRDAQGASA